MYGAILGDMIGAPYEFDRGDKSKTFPLFNTQTRFTDDTVMTVAVAEALMGSFEMTDDEIKNSVVASMKRWAEKYPNSGYGGMFSIWLASRNPEPYGSYGNGSAMRVSSAGWLFETLEETRRYAALTAEVTHNHPEGIKGAEATACAIFLARNGMTKAEIKEYIIKEFGYDLSRTCDDIRPYYHHVETCQETVPEAITAFLEGTDFEDVIRTAVSLGGDADTLTCIAGSIAEAFYGISDEMKDECRNRLPEDMLLILDRFDAYEAILSDESGVISNFLDGNEEIEKAISDYHEGSCENTLFAVIESVKKRMHENGHFMIPVITHNDETVSFSFQTIETDDKKQWFVVFTSHEEFEKGPSSNLLSNFIDTTLQACLDSDTAAGVIINPWGKPFALTRGALKALLESNG